MLVDFIKLMYKEEPVGLALMALIIIVPATVGLFVLLVILQHLLIV